MTDPLGLTVQPLAFLTYTSHEQLLEQLGKLIQEKSVELVVLGLPKSLDGTLGPKAMECERIAEKIRKNCLIRVHLQDERFTTREAEDFLIHELNLSREKRKKVKDSLAACIILQHYLRSQEMSR